ncbi:hypothetical protein EDD32_1919 [Georgenia muralis]|uniref:Uncharacterized protein n=1 Tax=Georgenia muralis TaxID=154117 RepID=A0A3N4Z2G5_9MICO|nr:hypothetical protein EDD32_1919 [Georgenia muralis]
MFAHGTRPAATARTRRPARCRPAATQVVDIAIPTARRRRPAGPRSRSPDRSTAKPSPATV